MCCTQGLNGLTLGVLSIDNRGLETDPSGIVCVVDGQNCNIRKRHHATQTDLVEYLVDLGNEIPQFKVFKTGELVLARLVKLGIHQPDTSFLQLLIDCHFLPSIVYTTG